MDEQQLKTKTRLSLHEAARIMAVQAGSVPDAEGLLAHAIEGGELTADILRWATEQWEGERLEGNLDRMRTFIERADLEAWLRRQGMGHLLA